MFHRIEFVTDEATETIYVVITEGAMPVPGKGQKVLLRDEWAIGEYYVVTAEPITAYCKNTSGEVRVTTTVCVEKEDS